MSGILTFLVGSTLEAWAEFRTHKARVIMSLIGVALAVLALTGVIAVGQVAQQSVTESLERDGGRPALLNISQPYQEGNGAPNTYPGDFDALVAAEMRRYGVRYWSPVINGQVTAARPDGAVQLQVRAVSPEYATMHRTRLAEGGWFRDSDARRLAPAIIIDSVLWKSLGSPPLNTHPSLGLVAPSAATAIIVGVTPGGYPGSPSAMMVADAYTGLQRPDRPAVDYGSNYEAWVPVSQARALSTRMASDLTRQAGEGWTVSVDRSDYAAFNGPDPLLVLKVVIAGAAGLILLLAALGLLNIAMVTVRTRIREIGIRRSFGATAGRVFFGVMMESVVATVAAGVVGVILAIFALKNPWVTDWLTTNAGLQDVPAFPLSAALLGLAVAAGVGALAGLLPALVAVRVKPIDAIRY